MVVGVVVGVVVRVVIGVIIGVVIGVVVAVVVLASGRARLMSEEVVVVVTVAVVVRSTTSSMSVVDEGTTRGSLAKLSSPYFLINPGVTSLYHEVGKQRCPWYNVAA